MAPSEGVKHNIHSKIHIPMQQMFESSEAVSENCWVPERQREKQKYERLKTWSSCTGNEREKVR